MLRLLIDDKAVEVEEGSTLLQAARKLSLEIPTLCFLEGYRPSSSCMLCVVEDLESGKTLPACSSLALDGMRIQTKSPGLDRLRKEALELLLSDHREFCFFEPGAIGERMRHRIVFDTRSCLSHERWEAAGFKVVTL